MARTTSKESALPSPPILAADGPVSYALVRLAKAHRDVAAALLRDIGLYPGQELMLMHLRDRDERTQAELVRALNLDPSTVTRMLARLEEQGVVKQRASSTDRRAVVVSLTPRGAKLCGEIRCLWTELEAATTQGMPKRDRDDVLRALQRMADRLAAEDA